MAGLFSRLKNWAKNENLKSADVNAEFNNIIQNLGPDKMSGFSTNVSQMQTQVSPGAQGSESLAQSTSDELTRLRYVINRIVGGTYWYDAPELSLTDVSILLNQGNASIPSTRMVSGLTRATSNQPAFLVADGSALKVTLKGSTTPFVYFVDGTEYRVTTDVDFTGLTAAATSATAAVNQSSAAAQIETKTLGEVGILPETFLIDSNPFTLDNIPIDTQTANFTAGAVVGTMQAFKITHAAVDEYFVGYVDTANSLKKCYRGYFFNSSSAPINRVLVSDNDVITFVKLNWIFLNSSGAMDATTNNPKVSFDSPQSPSSGDYWFDLNTKKWKKFNAGSFADANSILIGMAICTNTACVGTRSFDFYSSYDSRNSLALAIRDGNTLVANAPGAQVNVAGQIIRFEQNLPLWIKPDDLDTGVTDAISKTFYIYLKDTGDKVISDIPPYDRSADLQGHYHPYNPWRWLATVTNDGSSNFTSIASDADRSRASRAERTAGADFGTTSSSFSVIDRFTLTKTTTGNPVKIDLGGIYIFTSPASSLIDVQFILYRDGVALNPFNAGISQFRMSITGATAITGKQGLNLSFIDYPPAGTHVYTVGASVAASAGTPTLTIQSGVQMSANEAREK